MNPDDWIIVPGWEKFQHYKDRDPAWIKVYTKLLADPKFLRLPESAKGVLVTIWLAYAAENGAISVRFLHEIGPKRNHFRQLTALNHAGFIHFSASKPLAPLNSRDREELNPPKPPQPRASTAGAENELLQRAKHFASNWASNWTGGTSEQFDIQLDTLEEECHGRLTYSQRAQLWDIALGRGRR